MIMLVVIVSNLPDLDFLPGILSGEPNRYHHGFSHSLGFAVILSGLFFWIERYCRRGKKPWFSLGFFTLYTLHVVVDYFAMDTTAPYGEPLIWPFSTSFYIFPHPFFLDVERSSNPSQFFISIFSKHNLLAVLLEILFAVLFWLLVVWLKKLLDSHRSPRLER